jgi:hypothetical protein
VPDGADPGNDKHDACQGRHGFNTTVLPGNAVRIRGREARHSFALAGGMVKPVFEARP